MFAYLERAFVLDGPHTDADGHDGDEDKRDEDEQPQDLRPAVLELVTRQQLKHKQQHVHASTQHHALVVRVRLTLQPVGQKFTLLSTNLVLMQKSDPPQFCHYLILYLVNSIYLVNACLCLINSAS